MTGLGGGGIRDQNLAGQDEALGFFAAFGEPAGDQQQIEPLAFHPRSPGQAVAELGRGRLMSVCGGPGCRGGWRSR